MNPVSYEWLHPYTKLTINCLQTVGKDIYCWLTDVFVDICTSEPQYNIQLGLYTFNTDMEGKLFW